MKRALLLALLALPAGATCLVERHGWQTWVCDTDAEKPATGNREGDHVWAKDTNKLYYWDGAAWLQIGAGGGGGAPTTATYITQTPDAGLSAEQAMNALGTGLVKNTTGTGVQSIYAGAVCTSAFVRELSASGAPLCDSVNLIDDVSNTLGVTNGGTGLGSAADDNVMLGDGVDWVSQALPNCNDTAGRHLNYDTATNTVSCGTSSSGGGGGGVVEAEVDFGAMPGSGDVAVVVTGQAWVSGTSKIVCAPTAFSTADRTDGEEDAAIENLTTAVALRVAGTGFTVIAAPAFGEAIGKFKVHCEGV